MTRPSAQALALHAIACGRREAGYIDPQSGLFVLTSHHLRGEGECCGNGCRHCPWDEDEQRAAGRPTDAPAYPHPER